MEKYYRMDDYNYSNVSKERVLSNLSELDYCTKGFELGCITIWTGFTNAGKTTVMTMLAKNSIEQGERIFFFNGEQTKEDFKNNLYIQSSKKEDLYYKQYKTSNIYDTYVKAEKVAQLNKELANKIYIYNNENKKDINNLLIAMEELRQTQKIRVFFLDNFMQIDMNSDNQFQEQTLIMEKLRNFAVNKNVHIHLVAHPRKTERLQSRLTLYDVAGSSNLTNKAYNIISIMRTSNIHESSSDYAKLKLDLADERYNLDETDCILEVLKTKGNRCGLVGLTYDKDIKTYSIAPSITEETKNLITNEIKAKGNRQKCPF
jgi:twinkle protein